MAYLLDTDVFIQAANMHYGFDICPAFWDWIDRLHHQNKIFSIPQVRNEILIGRGELIAWVSDRDSLFVPVEDGKTYESLALLSSWAEANYKRAYQEEFFAAADFYLVGYAHAHNHTVVTHEKYSTGLKVKIPNACKAMDVPCINTWDLLKAERVRFILDGAAAKAF